MSESIFISYRREDSAADARSICLRLEKAFGSRRIFMDVDTIKKGSDFAKTLDEHLKRSRILIAVIGRRWLDAKDSSGNARLHAPDDFVRREIATALDLGICVLPVLVDGARLPTADQLPDDLKSLARRQALSVQHESFPADMHALELSIKAELRRNKSYILLALALLAVGIVAFLVALPKSQLSAWLAILDGFLGRINQESLDGKTGERAVRIRQTPEGLFVARCTVNNSTIVMLIDNISPMVILRFDDAKQSGLDVDRISYTEVVQTASGLFYAAKTQLREIKLGPISLTNVDALIAQPGSPLKTSILGRSFTSRMRSFEVAGPFITIRY